MHGGETWTIREWEGFEVEGSRGTSWLRATLQVKVTGVLISITVSRKDGVVS